MYKTTQQKLEKAQLLNKRHRKSIRDLNGVYMIARGRVASLTLGNQELQQNMSLMAQHKGRVEARCTKLHDQVKNLQAELQLIRTTEPTVVGHIHDSNIVAYPPIPTAN